MDLSSVPTEVLQAEHDVVDKCTRGVGITPVCAWVMKEADWSCVSCPIVDACAELVDPSTGWRCRKERYLAEIRAAIAERSRLSQSSTGVVC